MSEEQALSWSGKWHYAKPVNRDGCKYLIALCGAYLVRNDDPRYPSHLKSIKAGTRKSTGFCKSCSRSSGSVMNTATVGLPWPSRRESATDDVNGYSEWDYPHGTVAVTDDGTIMWGSWHITDLQKIRDAGVALLAAADFAERVK